MIQYNSMRLYEAVDKVMLRLGQQMTALNLDWQTVATFVNRARMEVLSRTVAYKQWAYLLRNVPVIHGERFPDVTIDGVTMPLSALFIQPIRVLLRPDTEAENVEMKEARYVDVREFFSLSDWQTKQSWNPAATEFPIWTFFGALNDGAVDDHMYFYAAPNAEAEGFLNWQSGTAPSGYTYYTDSMRGVMDCYCGYPDTLDANAQLHVPAEYENLLILFASMRAMARIGQTGKLLATQRDTIEEEQKIRNMYQVGRQNAKRNLESLVDMPKSNQQQRNG